MYNCGKCPLCRERKRKQWASRMEMESKMSKSTFFVTLTYRDECLLYSENIPDPSLSKVHYSNFLKTLRKRLPFSIRFFGVGEYGKESKRPHYHFIIFCPVYINKHKFRRYINEVWKYGFNTVKDANVKRFYYIAKYVTKETRAPLGTIESFQTCSQNPPIGYNFFRNNNDLYRNMSVNYMVSPTFRKSSLPRSFENHIKNELSNVPRDSVTDPVLFRSRILRKRAGILLQQYVKDFNVLGPEEFVLRRDEIMRRLSKHNYKLNSI